MMLEIKIHKQNSNKEFVFSLSRYLAFFCVCSICILRLLYLVFFCLFNFNLQWIKYDYTEIITTTNYDQDEH
jgi:hypothetical protein